MVYDRKYRETVYGALRSSWIMSDLEDLEGAYKERIGSTEHICGISPTSPILYWSNLSLCRTKIIWSSMFSIQFKARLSLHVSFLTFDTVSCQSLMPQHISGYEAIIIFFCSASRFKIIGMDCGMPCLFQTMKEVRSNNAQWTWSGAKVEIYASGQAE